MNINRFFLNCSIWDGDIHYIEFAGIITAWIEQMSPLGNGKGYGIGGLYSYSHYLAGI